MTHIAGKASNEDSPILHAAIGLAPQIHAASEEIEQDRRLPRPIAEAMKAAVSSACPCRARGVGPNWIR
jgi:hypothetical protein